MTSEIDEQSTPNKSNKRGARGQARQNKSSSAVDRLIIGSAKATGSTSNIVDSDLRLKRQNFNIVTSPPRSLGNQTFWAKLSLDLSFGISNVSVSENNFALLYSSFNGYSGSASFFDQYCMYGVTCTFTSNLTSGVAIYLMTAIDYDNIANIGIAGIQSFTSFNECVLGGNAADSLVRFLKPCVAPQVTSSNLPVAGGVGRMWLDVAYPSVQHYGMRVVIPVSASTTAGAVSCTVSAIFGFRNNQ
jgi:hypothetical protein